MGQSSFGTVSRGGTIRATASPLPVHTSPFACRFRISNVGYAVRVAHQSDLVRSADREAFDTEPVGTLPRFEKAPVVGDGRIVQRLGVVVVRPAPVDHAANRHALGHVGDAGELIVAVGRWRRLGRDEPHVIRVEVRQERVVNLGIATGRRHAVT